MRKYRGLRTEMGNLDQIVNQNNWAYGYFFQIWERTYILWGTTNGIPNMEEVAPETVGQFTGLKDKNGVDDFAGNIIKVKIYHGSEPTSGLTYGNFEVVWVEDEAGFMLRPLFTSEDELWEYDTGIEDFEIIGNIHQPLPPSRAKEGKMI